MNNKPMFSIGEKVLYKGEKHKITGIQNNENGLQYILDDFDIHYRGGYSMPLMLMEVTALESELKHAK